MSDRLPRVRTSMSAYDFLTGPLVAAILEEPRRIWMNVWMERNDDESGDHATIEISQHLEAYGMGYFDALERAEGMTPTCGTIACIGGWTEVMVGLSGRHDPVAVGKYGTAKVVLGLTDEQGEELFYPLALIERQDQGTEVFARDVAAHVSRFAERHADQLRGHTVVPEGRLY